MKLITGSRKLRITDFVRKNRKELFVLVIILLIAAFLRLYRIGSYMTFLGDEGRDVIIVRDIFVKFHPPLIGPGTSIGNMYLGPLYYYMMAIPLLLAGFSPVGPAVMIAVLGIITVGMVWWIGREWFTPAPGRIAWGALIASGLYAISPTVIIYSRSSWNPNIMPFFALIAIYSVWRVWKYSEFNWLVVMGLSLAFILQSHYMGLLLVPTLLLFWVLTFINLKLDKNRRLLIGKFLQKTIIGLLFFAGLMSPLFFFDIRHNFMNSRAIITFFANNNGSIAIRPLAVVSKIPQVFNLVMTDLLSGKNPEVGIFVSIALFFCFATTLMYISVVKKMTISPYWLIVAWVSFGILGLGFYRLEIYDHYFGFLFPAPFLIVGGLSEFLLSFRSVVKRAAVLVVLTPLVVVSIINNPFKYAPNNQMGRAEDVAKKIEQESGGNRFNLGVIAATNYEDGYKYFLLKDGALVIDIDSQVKGSITDQLFVVCELPEEQCDPTHNSTAAIANFGWSKIEDSWNVDGVIVYKLVHYTK